MKNLKFRYLIILFLIAMLFPFNVSAKEDITLRVNRTKLNPGDSVSVIVDLDYNNSLYALKAGLSFFEVLETHNFEEQDNWSDIVYNEENNEFALLNKSGQTKEHLLMAKLFVKEKPKAGDTEISLVNPIGSDGKKDIEFHDVSRTLTI